MTFDEKTHSYFVDGKQLPSVTQILENQGISPDLSYVKNLKNYADFGTYIHQNIHEHLSDKKATKEYGFELENVNKFLKENNYTAFATEKQLYVADKFAGCVDLIVKNDQDEYAIVDFKTGTIQKNTVMWQLNMYRYLFEKNNPNEKVVKLYCMDKVADDTCSTYQVQYIADDIIEKMLDCYYAGKKYYDASNLTLTVDFEVLDNALFAIAEYEQKIKDEEQKIAQIKEQVMSAMAESAVKKIDTNRYSICYVAPAERKTFDSTKFKKDHPEMVADYEKTSTTKASLRITKKGE